MATRWLDTRQAGTREAVAGAVAVSSAGGADVSCPTKGGPTTPPSKQSQFDSRVEDYTLCLADFELPGLGEAGEICGTDRLPEKNAVCPNGDAVRYEPNRCRKVECPDCYLSEDRGRLFEKAVQIEGMARIEGERPHVLAWSVPKEEAANYSIKNINQQLMRRGRRRSRRKSGVVGGVSFVHPGRLEEEAKRELREAGYASGGSNGGYWEGVRDDALGLGDWREYVYYSPHGHSIGFPERIEEHSGTDFVVNKYDVLEDTASVVNHTGYLMTHRGVWRGDGQFTSIRPWGTFHHASKDYVDVEEELSASEYRAVCEAVASELGGEWSEREGLHYPEEEACCPVCGTDKRKFIDLYDLMRLASDGWQGGSEWKSRLSESQLAFFEEIVAILQSSQQPIIQRGDVIHPSDVEAWVDGDLPPPEE